MTETGPAIDLIVERDTAETRRDEAVTLGLPWPRGVLSDQVAKNRLWLLGPDSLASELPGSAGERRAPVQTRVLERWSDGSVRWLLVHALVSSSGSERDGVRLEVGPVHETVVEGADETWGRFLHPVADGGYRVDTGRKTVACSAGCAFPLAAESSLLEHAALEVEAKDGQVRRARFDSVETVEAGPLYSQLRASGSMAVGRRTLRLEVLLGFFRDQSSVDVQLTVHNPDRAWHKGGVWELGDSGSIRFRQLRLVLAVPESSSRSALLSSDGEIAFESMPNVFELQQLASGGENWRSPVHQNASGVVPLTEGGFRVVDGGGVVLGGGRRATPRLIVAQGGRSIGLAMQHFWQNFPKSLSVSGRSIELGLFPACHGDGYELQGGEQKTHRFSLDLADSTSEPNSCDLRAIAPAHLRATPEHYAACGIEQLLRLHSSNDPDPFAEIQALALDGANSFFAKREIVDEYGWRNFGEVWADHEALHHDGDDTFVSHYNNQYDGIYAFGLQYLRTGDRRWFELMDDLARHVADIDIYHTDRDKAAYSGGLFWHTAHYVPAGRSTHRTYPSGTCGGGPSSEHAYSKGLMLHYFLTGDSMSRRAVTSIADWLVRADNGDRLPWSLLDSGPTGAISSTVEPDYHGPGRGPGNAIVCLLVAYRLDSDPVYLRLAEELVFRCIHPDDDPTALGLAADPERRWSYTVFLHALADVIEWKRERGELDRTFHYSRSALLRYAEWMVEHEYFYLDRPEKLEYPNDTWAAQELRKSEVLALAALELEPSRRGPFVERAFELRDRSLERLLASRELSLSRLLILSLRYGGTLSGISDQPPALLVEELAAAGEVEGFPGPQLFLSRRDRLMRRFPVLHSARRAVQAAAQVVGR